MPEALNSAQQAAVDHDAGPLIVLAGPGTGKTRVIVHRIQRLIESGADPGHILAVTFTVKAAVQLRRRLADLVGAARADRVHARTFHGFAQHLVSRFGDMLGLPPRHAIIDSAQRTRLAREVARRDGLLAGFSAEGLGNLLAACQECADAIQNAGLCPGRVEEFCRDWLSRIDGNTEGLDATALAAERIRHARFLAQARLHAAASEQRRRRGQLTFEDLILLATRLLREHDLAAALCRDEFRHVVVDEFQDVNAGQIDLLRGLCPSRAGGGPDLCVVGDDDQSVYLFRGADDRAFSTFAACWPGAATISLTENYRSEPCILAVAAATIARAEDRFAPDKTVERAESLRGLLPAPGSGVECIECEDDSHQFGEAVAAMIKTDRVRHPARAWSDFAVIAVNHLDLSRVSAALEAEGIPHIPSRPPSALDEPGVQDVLAWIGLLAEPASTKHAHRLLVRPPVGAPPGSVNDWLLAFHAQASRHRHGESGRPDPGVFTDWLARHHAADASAAHFTRLHGAIRAVALQHPADRAILEIVRLTDTAHADLCPARDRARRVTALADLMRFAHDRAPFLDEPGDLRAFHAYFKELSDGDKKSFQRDEDDRLEGGDDEHDQPDAVTLLTAHKAKGLEFDTVFVVRVSPRHGFGMIRDDGADLPVGLEDRADDTRTMRDRRRAEARRLFYVACTRAKRRLVLLAKRKKLRSEGDFYQELTGDHPDLVVCRAVQDVFHAAAEGGVTLASRNTVLADSARGGRRGWDQELAAQRSAARAEAALALESVDRADATLADIDLAAAAVRDAAARLAVIASMDLRRTPPGWSAGIPAARAVGEALAHHLAGERAPSAVTRAMTPPLNLNYSAINQYNRCPRCFYLTKVLKFPDQANDALLVGDIAHRALQAYFNALRRHESDGGPPPQGIADVARALYFASLPPGAPADEDTLAQLAAMLTAATTALHRPTDEIAEIEFSLTFPYTHNGVEHTFTTKMDRLDVWPAGGHRIIDYKTGKPTDDLIEPSDDDLQLGVYALALRHHQGIPLADRETPALGVAEYWHLPTGQRGRLDLSRINYPKIRRRIGGAIDGMLAGDFEPVAGCRGLCTYIRL
ncbi:MAG: ATP-dependent helicase [Phycisphaerales bacterium]|nr:ATP-dependent helicase [Phycisphaerales bacterium]